jgi:hypothetical protein
MQTNIIFLKEVNMFMRILLIELIIILYYHHYVCILYNIILIIVAKKRIEALRQLNIDFEDNDNEREVVPSALSSNNNAEEIEDAGIRIISIEGTIIIIVLL